MKTNVKILRAKCNYNCTLIKYEYLTHEFISEIEVKISDDDPDNIRYFVERKLFDEIEAELCNDDVEIQDIDIYNMKYEIISDSVPPSEVMRAEGCKELFE